MIGDAYFELRTRLAGLLAELRGEAETLGQDAETRLILENLTASLSEPFVFVVVGEVNVGKSTFLNALFGQDFSRTGVVPTTDKILFFKYGEKVECVPVTPTLDEVRVPAAFLKDFHIVDTPGTNSIEGEHQEITERFVPASDLVVFVFSATNPWAASAWQFLERVHREWMRNVIFVLQQCDLRTPEEVQVITDYMGQLTRQRFGREFPIFPVSAKHAYLARSSGLDREALMAASGFESLEQHISRAVTGSAARMGRLRTACQLLRSQWQRLADGMAQTLERTRTKAELIDELAAERNLQIERTLKKITPAVDATERDYHDSAVRVAGLAANTLSTERAFRRLPDDEDEEQESADDEGPPPSLDHRLFQDLQRHNGDRWRQVAMILDEDVHHYERFLHAKGRATLFLPAEEDAASEDSGRMELRRRFLARIDGALRRFVVGLRLDESIEPGFNKAHKRARRIPVMLVPILLVIGLAWWFVGWREAGAAALGGLLLLGALFLLTKATLTATRRELIDKLDVSSSQLHDLLSHQVTEEVEAAFARFSEILNPAREDANSRLERLRERVALLERLGEKLTALEQDLRSDAAPA